MWTQRLHESIESVDNDYGRLYGNMMRELRESTSAKAGHRYFAMLWASVAPKGNIYRRNGLYAEHRKHSEDIWAQMMELAEEHSKLLGGTNVPAEERAERLNALLARTTCQGCVQPDHGDADVKDAELAAGEGFPPLQEWLSEKVVRVGPFLVHQDAEKWQTEAMHVFMALGIFALQVIAPFLIFLNRWNTSTNYLRDWSRLKRHLNFWQLACLGDNLSEVLTVLMGVLLLFVIIFMVRCYIKEQLANAHKSSKLPTDLVWFLMGVTANAWSCIFTCIDIPLLFWSEETPTNIVLDSMTLLFLFKLDDLSDILCSHLDMTDEDFQRLAAWQCALLSQCPVDVADLIDASANRPEDLWSIKYSADGRLCSTKGGPSKTRLSHVSLDGGRGGSDESSPLVATGVEHTIYRPSRGCEHELPSMLARALICMWQCTRWISWVAQYVIPIFWYLINKRCSKLPKLE